MEAYGLIADLSLSPARASAKAVGDTPTRAYFSRQSNLAFHDLTPGKIVPQQARTVLGLNLKFIPTPRRTTASTTIAEAIDRLDRDISLKTFFAGEEKKDDDDEYHPALYMKSEWRPPDVYIPATVTKRIQRFHQRLKRVFYACLSASNLNSDQRKYIQAILDDPRLLIVLADKGLGPCAVTYEQYVQDVLKHLENRSTYRRLSPQDARMEATVTATKINAWCNTLDGRLPAQLDRIHRRQCEESSRGAFGVFLRHV